MPTHSIQALRERAEEVTELTPLPPAADRSPEEMKQVLHELEVHQIELQMQNEELQAAHAQLDTLRAKYFDLYDLAPVGYITVSENGIILETNLTAANMLGLSRDKVVRRQLAKFIHPQHQDIYYLHRSALLNTSSSQAFELRMLRDDGTCFWARLEAVAAQDDKGAAISRITMSDISLPKQAENDLMRTVTDLNQAQTAALLGSWTWYVKTNQMEWSNEMYHIFGIDKASFSGSLVDIMRTSMGQVTRDVIDLSGTAGERTDDQPVSDHCILRPDKSERTIWISGIKHITDENGNLVALTGVVQDVTKQKHNEAVLLHSLAEKDILLKEIHHRVKNNLQVIASLMDLQSATINAGNAIEALQNSKARVLFIARLHQQLYQSENLSSIRAGRFLRDIALFLRQTHGRDNIVIKDSIEDLILDIDRAIPSGLIVNELITNAFKHAFATDTTGEIGLSFKQDGDSYELCIHNTGTPLPGDFDMNHAGTLGLRLVGMLTHQLGGTIAIELGEKTVFRIKFPM